ncbi:hypothetical protein D3C80_373650 [compost metagenome]
MLQMLFEFGQGFAVKGLQFSLVGYCRLIGYGYIELASDVAEFLIGLGVVGDHLLGEGHSLNRGATSVSRTVEGARAAKV